MVAGKHDGVFKIVTWHEYRLYFDFWLPGVGRCPTAQFQVRQLYLLVFMLNLLFDLAADKTIEKNV